MNTFEVMEYWAKGIAEDAELCEWLSRTFDRPLTIYLGFDALPVSARTPLKSRSSMAPMRSLSIARPPQNLAGRPFHAAQFLHALVKGTRVRQNRAAEPQAKHPGQLVGFKPVEHPPVDADRELRRFHHFTPIQPVHVLSLHFSCCSRASRRMPCPCTVVFCSSSTFHILR